LFIKKDKI